MKTTNSSSSSCKEDLLRIVTETYKSVIKKYKDIFNKKGYLPTKTHSSLGINGFTERNLTFNFCNSYLENQEAIVWQEIPFFSEKHKRQHVDSIIIDEKNKWVIYLEAKRFYNLRYFNNILIDLNRIKNNHLDIPLPKNFQPDHKAVVLLADHYCHDDCNGQKYKLNYYDKFFTGQDVDELPPTIKEKDSEFADSWTKNIESSKISSVCDSIEESIISIKGSKYNIDINDEIVYTIYCGVYFIQ